MNAAAVTVRRRVSEVLWISKLGFVQTGVQWDERDGEELVFEVDVT